MVDRKHSGQVAKATDAHNRRQFVRLLASASLACPALSSIARAEEQRPPVRRGKSKPARKTIAVQSDDHITVHYKRPYDYGVMRGLLTVPESEFVGKNIDQPNTFFLGNNLDQPNTLFQSNEKRIVWANQHMDALQRTQQIRRGSDVLPFQSIPLDFNNVKLRDVNGGIVPSYKKWLELEHTVGFTVVYLSKTHGPIVATEDYLRGLTPHTPHMWWSASKSAAASFIAHGIAEKKFTRETPVTALLPELAKNSHWDGALMEHVLDQTSGVTYRPEGFRDDPDMGLRMGWIRHAQAAGFLEGKGAPKEHGSLPYLSTLPKTRAHGSYFDYGDVNPGIATAAARHTYGNRPFHELFSEKVWSRIGAEHNAFICADEQGDSLVGWGLASTLRDFSRWGLAHLPASSRSAVPRDFVERLRKPFEFKVVKGKTSPDMFDSVLKHLTQDGGLTNLYWIHRQGEAAALNAAGWFEQRCAIFPHLNTVVTRFCSNMGNPNNVHQDVTLREIAEYVAMQYARQGL